MNRCLSKKTICYYTDGFLSGRKRQKAENHLSGCPACRAEAEAYQALKKLPAFLPEPAPEEKYWDRFVIRLEKSLSGGYRPAFGELVYEKVKEVIPAFVFLAAVCGLILQTALFELLLKRLKIADRLTSLPWHVGISERWLALALVILAGNIVLVLAIPFLEKKREQIMLRPVK